MALSRKSSIDDVRVGRNGHYLNETSVLSSSYSLSNGNGFRDVKHRNCCYRCWIWAKDGFTIIANCFAILTFAITAALSFQLIFGRPQVSPEGAVSTDDGDCSDVAGLQMIREQGNAVDATVAALICCSVTHPHLLGVGGGGVMLIHDHLQMKTKIIDFLPDIPAAFNSQRRRHSDIGGSSIAIPGFLQGLHYAHSKYGKLPWDKLFEPAIRKARQGFTVSHSLEAAVSTINPAAIPSPPPFSKSAPRVLPPLHRHVRSSSSQGDERAASSSSTLTTGTFKAATEAVNAFSAMFLPFGSKIKRGTKVTRRPYADLLEKVAKFGPKAVFDTDFAVEVVTLLREAGSYISVSELQNYEVEEYDAIQATYRNQTVLTAPHPFGGAQLLSALHLLDNSGLNSTTSLPRLYESITEALQATKFSYYRMAYEPENRHSIGEKLLDLTSRLSLTDFVDSADHEAHGNSNDTETRRHLVEDFRRLSAAIPQQGLAGYPRQSATQVSAVDTYDLYVSAVCGLGTIFGSQLMTPHGVLFNNFLNNVPKPTGTERGGQQQQPGSGTQSSKDDSSNLTHDKLDAQKHERSSKIRPLTTYAPFILVEPRKICGWRSVCSSSSVSDSLQVLAHRLFKQLPLNAAVEQARVYLDSTDDHKLLLDLSGEGAQVPAGVKSYLSQLSYGFEDLGPSFGSVNSVSKYMDSITSHSDTRGGGLAARLQEGKKEVVEFDGSVGDLKTDFVSAGGRTSQGQHGQPPIKTDSGNVAVEKSDKETASTTEENTASGLVVKGDKRGNVDEGSEVNVNGGRGGNENYNLFVPHNVNPSKAPPLVSNEALVNAGQGTVSDNVFGDEGHLESQVRVESHDHQQISDYNADYIDESINIWGQTEHELIPLRPHSSQLPHPHGRIVLPPRLPPHIQQSQAQNAPNLLPVIKRPGLPPIIIQRQGDHSHPVFGSVIAGPYSDIKG